MSGVSDLGGHPELRRRSAFCSEIRDTGELGQTLQPHTAGEKGRGAEEEKEMMRGRKRKRKYKWNEVVRGMAVFKKERLVMAMCEI